MDLSGSRGRQLKCKVDWSQLRPIGVGVSQTPAIQWLYLCRKDDELRLGFARSYAKNFDAVSYCKGPNQEKRIQLLLRDPAPPPRGGASTNNLVQLKHHWIQLHVFAE